MTYLLQSVITISISSCLVLSGQQASALSDPYFAAGEDLDYLIESDNSLAIQEMEYKLRKFTFFRKVEDFVRSLKTDPIETDEVE